MAHGPLVLFGNVILQHFYYNVTIKLFRFVNALLTASNKGELANLNAAYKAIALKYPIDSLYVYFVHTSFQCKTITPQCMCPPLGSRIL